MKGGGTGGPVLAIKNVVGSMLASVFSGWAGSRGAMDERRVALQKLVLVSVKAQKKGGDFPVTSPNPSGV